MVTFDSMSLRSSLKYLENDDHIAGFVDLDEFGASKGEVAKNALQFMVCGICSHWKQPVLFHRECSFTKCSESHAGKVYRHLTLNEADSNSSCL